MGFQSSAAPLLGSSAQRAVLSALLRAAGPLSGNAVAREAHVSPRGAWLVLRRLQREGLVLRSRVGSSDAWILVPGHAAVPALRALLAPSSKELERSIQRAVNDLPVKRAVLFGSVARGEENPGSDVDVLFVVPDEKRREQVLIAVQELNRKLMQRYGTAVVPLAYTLREFQQRRKTPLMQRIEKEGRVLVTS